MAKISRAPLCANIRETTTSSFITVEGEEVTDGYLARRGAPPELGHVPCPNRQPQSQIQFRQTWEFTRWYNGSHSRRRRKRSERR
jgi:hypothetical protein